jgi:hypothetical protein
MRTLRSGSLYLFPIESDIFAAAPTRVWWAPWRWSLRVYWWQEVELPPPERIAHNITKAHCIGLIKLLGYPYEIQN